MSKGKAFFLVGHKHWGKSLTLIELQGGDWRKHGSVFIKGHKLFVRRMSNDDIPNSYFDFLHGLDADEKPLLIMTLCPDFDNPPRKVANALRKLSDKYELFFWVMKFRWEHDDWVTVEEIRQLHALGTVEIYDGRHEKDKRARIFKKFIASRL